MAVKKKIDMGNGSLFKGILAFAIPYMLTGLLGRLYNAADMVVVGRYASQEALAGVGASGSLTELILDMFLGLSVGASVSLGRSLGAGDREKTRRIVHTATAISLIGGAIVSFIGVFFAEPLLSLIDVPESVMPHAKKYMIIIFSGRVWMLLYTFCAAMLRAKGDSKRPLYIGMASGALNVLLNLVFVLGFKMQADGVALASVISQLLSAILVVILFLKEDDETKLNIRKIKIHKDELVEILKIGIPSGIQASVFALANVIIQWGVNSLGDTAMAGTTAAGNVASFYYLALNTFAQAAVTFVSFNMGARKYDRVKKSVRICLLYVVAVWVIEAIITAVAGEFLVSLYAPGNAGAIEVGALRLATLGYTYGLCGLMEVFSGALRGMGYAFSSMLMSVCGVCGIRITWVLTVFKNTLGVLLVIESAAVLFYAMPLSWIGTLLLQYAFYFYATHSKRFMMLQADSH